MRVIVLITLLAACGGSTPAPKPTPAQRTGPLFVAGEAIAYEIKDGDAIVGRAHSRYEESGGNVTVVTRVAFERPKRTFEYATSCEGRRPVSLKRISSLDGRSLVTLAKDQTVLPEGDLMLLAMELERSGLEPGQSRKLTVKTPDNPNADGWLVRVYADAERNTIVDLPSGKAVLSAGGQITRFTSRDGWEYTLLKEAGEPPQLLPMPEVQNYTRPRDASWTDRRLDGAIVSIPGYRARWEDARNVPGVVLLLEDRTNPQMRWQLGNALADAGFAVLRFEGPTDAKAAVDLLREQQDVDPNKIIVIGHGKAGHTAIITAQSEVLKAVALVAMPHPNNVVEITAGVTEPLGVFTGFGDDKVSWKDDSKPFVETVNKKKKDQAKLFVYEHVGHWMLEKDRLSPDFSKDLIEWLTERAR